MAVPALIAAIEFSQRRLDLGGQQGRDQADQGPRDQMDGTQAAPNQARALGLSAVTTPSRFDTHQGPRKPSRSCFWRSAGARSRTGSILHSRPRGTPLAAPISRPSGSDHTGQSERLVKHPICLRRKGGVYLLRRHVTELEVSCGKANYYQSPDLRRHLTDDHRRLRRRNEPVMPRGVVEVKRKDPGRCGIPPHRVADPELKGASGRSDPDAQPLFVFQK